jgi:hypothetical protein
MKLREMIIGSMTSAQNNAPIDAVSDIPIGDSFKLLGDVIINNVHIAKGTMTAGYCI